MNVFHPFRFLPWSDPLDRASAGKRVNDGKSLKMEVERCPKLKACEHGFRIFWECVPLESVTRLTVVLIIGTRRE